MSALPDDSLQMVKWKEEQFRQIKESELSRRLAELANVWLSTFFGNKVKEDDYYELQGHLSPEKFPDWAGLREKEWFGRAQEIAGEKRFFHWELEFPEAFAEEKQGFDVVIGNPPYVDSENMVRNLPDEREVISKQFETANGNWDLYIPFWELALCQINAKGKASLITPNKWIAAGYGLSLREYSKNNLYQIGDYSRGKVFDEASIFPVVVFMDKQVHQELNIEIFDENFSLIRQNSINMDMFKSIENWGIVFSKDPLTLIKVQEKSLALSEIFKVSEASTVSEAYELPVLLSETKQENPDAFKFIITGTIDRYASLWDLEPTTYLKNIYIKPVIKKSEFQKSFPKRFLQASSKKIIVSGIRHFETFLDNEGDYVAGKSTTIILKDSSQKYDLSSLLSILNSRLMTFFIQQVYGNLSMDGGINFRALLVSELPIPRISFTTPVPERAHLVAELRQLYDEGKHDEILAWVESLLPKDDAGNFIPEQEKSDVVHDLLAFLAERMLEMNKQKQQEIRGFLDWLEGYLGAKIEDLKPKTRILSYYDSDYESLLAVLKKNKKKLTIDPSRREPGELLRSEFEGSKKKLDPLMERIEKTDELIDAGVYKLYGLTDEEIGIVKGNSA
jgi:hypothetical protein